jgi:hypothetical protein
VNKTGTCPSLTVQEHESVGPVAEDTIGERQSVCNLRSYLAQLLSDN